MAHIRLILRVVGAALAFGVYVWYAAVRNAPTVKRRKAARRSRRARPDKPE